MANLQTYQVAKQLGGAVMSRHASYLIIFITARCNLLCDHCFYTEEIQNAKRDKELSVEEFQIIAKKSKPLTNVNFTGGEPFIRKDISNIVALFRKYNGAPFIGITTNGLLRDRILSQVEEISSQKGPYYLKLGVSLDGFEAVHDKTRGRIGSFKEAIKTIEALNPLREKFPGLMVYVSTTVTKYNKESIKEFIDFVRNELPVDAQYLGYCRGDAMIEETKDVTASEYKEATQHLQQKWNTKNFFFNLLNLTNTWMQSVNQQIIAEDRYIMPCVAGEKMLTITEDGLVKPCEVLEQIGVTPYVMGDLREHDYDIEKILSTPMARDIRRRILEENCYCTFECANQASIAYKIPNLLNAMTIHARGKMGRMLDGRLGAS